MNLEIQIGRPMFTVQVKLSSSQALFLGNHLSVLQCFDQHEERLDIYFYKKPYNFFKKEAAVLR